MNKRVVKWNDRPPVWPKLLIKLLVYASLLAMSFYAVIKLRDANEVVEDAAHFRKLVAVLITFSMYRTQWMWEP
jgi:LytS/YehU family sensor histidine kinase